jgi:Carboxypeptidase regulatory-like domain
MKTSIALLILFVCALSGRADVCVYKPLNVRQVWGFIVDPSGSPISGVNVRVLQDGKPSESAITDQKGRFKFESLKDGEYEVDATAPGFQYARYKLTLRNSTHSWNRSLRIELAVGGIHCGGSITETKQVFGMKR